MKVETNVKAGAAKCDPAKAGMCNKSFADVASACRDNTAKAAASRSTCLKSLGC